MNFHPRFKTMHYLLLQSFWVLSPHSAIYQCLSNSIKCFKCKPEYFNPYMADLPSKWRAFTSVCIDSAEPFSILTYRQRSAKAFKGYLYFCLYGTANNELLKLAISCADTLSIKLLFNTHGAHLNELAESGVKSFKNHLHSVLCWKSLFTLLTQIDNSHLAIMYYQCLYGAFVK